MLTKESIYQTYVRTICSNCKNKTKFMRNIRISNVNNITQTKCEYYERQD